VNEIAELAHRIRPGLKIEILAYMSTLEFPKRVPIKNPHGNLILMLEDNGSGFVPGTRPGNGLYNMKERARLLGGTFDLETTPGEGTTIRVKIPEENGTTT
jgi:signal transduction histidine kinase